MTDSRFTRRRFIASAGVAAGATALAAQAQDNTTPGRRRPAPSADQPFALLCEPVLQNPTGRSITVAWAVNGPATGWVEYGPTPNLGQRAQLATHGLHDYSSRYLTAIIEGLTPGQRVHYRAVAAPIDFQGPYRISQGEPVTSATHAFTVPDPAATEATVAMINDTHENVETLAALTASLREQPADFTVWNGDVFNDIHSHEQIIANALSPVGAAYAADRPVLFTSGNHDVRGRLARELAHVFTPWRDNEPLGRCFAVRHGPVAMIGLDTGEDKPDAHPAFAGLAAFEPYRRAQRDWLAATLQQPHIAEAPYILVFCHIPLVGTPGENGGDTMQGYGSYRRDAHDLWTPLLNKARVQVVLSGHIHRLRHLPPEGDRTFMQITGGGPQPDRATLIRIHATAKQLNITAHALDGKPRERWQFPPRSA